MRILPIVTSLTLSCTVASSTCIHSQLATFASHQDPSGQTHCERLERVVPTLPFLREELANEVGLVVLLAHEVAAVGVGVGHAYGGGGGGS